MRNFPPALRLLSILACLPNGIPRNRLEDITNISRVYLAADTLREVDLARYEDEVLKAIPPIRLYVSQHHPPNLEDVLSCRRYYRTLIGLSVKCNEAHEVSQVAATLAPELGNIHQMLYYWIDSGEKVEDAASAVLDLSKFLYLTPHRTDLVERVLQNKKLPLSRAMTVALLHMQGMACVVLSDYSTARECLEQASSIYAELKNKVGTVACTWALGDMYRVQGHYIKARELLNSALEDYRRLGTRFKISEAACLWSLGDTLDTLGECEEGSAFAHQARDIYKSLNNQAGATAVTLLCTSIETYRGNYALARSTLESTIEECKRVQDTSNLRNCLLLLGELCCFIKDLEPAKIHLNEALKLYEKYGCKQGLADTYRFLGTAA
jgi:tetratricopeptide (TPR) repeat protein